MTTVTEITTTSNLDQDQLVVIDIETTISGTVSAQIQDILIAQTLLKNTLLFLKKVGIKNSGEAADLLHSTTIGIWEEVDHEDLN